MKDECCGGLLPDIKKFIGSPNPIIPKLQDSQNMQPQVLEPTLDESDQQEGTGNEIYSLATAYSPKQLAYLKWRRTNNTRNGTQFFASHFFDQWEGKGMEGWEGPSSEDSLIFDSNFEGGNLLAVYRVGEEYDLVLQNDTNTGGYTQWFNFKVSNGRRRGTVRLNLINFYKKDSLYNDSMKPLSKSLVHDKDWKRSAHHVQYFPNEFTMEGRKLKHYRTLAFSYDFIFEQDTVQFAYALPYSYNQLQSWINTLNSPKLRVKYMGVSSLKNIISLLHISSENHTPGRRAIVFMGRQHPGQTPSSYVLQSLVEELLKPGQEMSFLLDQFQFFVFPMVNVDGVSAGNYRCNLRGLDLNRCWHLDDCKNMPQIVFIKNQLRKIMKKMPVATIVDVHGHSSKFNSFFYGNSFGCYNMTLPYVASKLSPFVDLSSCSFSPRQSSKASTARVILGNLIKDTGSVYTYEISLFGGLLKNGKKVPFLVEHYRQLAINLLSALAKSHTEFIKEEKSLKGSLFLKEAAKELQKMETILSREDSGSDEEAQKTTRIEERAKKNQIRQGRKVQQSYNIDKQRTGHFVPTRDASTDAEQFNEDQYSIIRREAELSFRRQIKKGVIFSSRREISQSTDKPKDEPQNRKQFLLSKLRIFGQNYIPSKREGSQREELFLKKDKDTQTTFTAKVLRVQKTVGKGKQSLNGYLQWYGEKRKERDDIARLTARHSRSNPSGLVTACLPFPGPISLRKIGIQ